MKAGALQTFLVLYSLVYRSYKTSVDKLLICFLLLSFVVQNLIMSDQVAKAHAQVRPWTQSSANQQISANAPQAGGGSSPGARRQQTKAEKASGPETKMQARGRSLFNTMDSSKNDLINGILRDQHELTKMEMVEGASEVREQAQRRGSSTICHRTQQGTIIVEVLQASYLTRDIVNLLQEIALDLDVAHIDVTVMDQLLPSAGKMMHTTRANIDGLIASRQL